MEPSKEKYFYNMISAYNDGGKIFKLPTAFSVPVLLGDEETLAAKDRDELMKIFQKRRVPESRSSLRKIWPERQAMEEDNEMTYWVETLYPSGGFSPDLELYFGEAQAGVGRISMYEDFIRILAVRREKGLSYQYLNREKGNYFVAESVLGINSNGKDPESAAKDVCSEVNLYLSE